MPCTDISLMGYNTCTYEMFVHSLTLLNRQAWVCKARCPHHARVNSEAHACLRPSYMGLPWAAGGGTALKVATGEAISSGSLGQLAADGCKLRRFDARRLHPRLQIEMC